MRSFIRVCAQLKIEKQYEKKNAKIQKLPAFDPISPEAITVKTLSQTTEKVLWYVKIKSGREQRMCGRWAELLKCVREDEFSK